MFVCKQVSPSNLMVWYLAREVLFNRGYLTNSTESTPNYNQSNDLLLAKEEKEQENQLQAQESYDLDFKYEMDEKIENWNYLDYNDENI